MKLNNVFKWILSIILIAVAIVGCVIGNYMMIGVGVILFGVLYTFTGDDKHET